MKRRLLAAALIFITAIVFAACDAKGRLNDKETAKLYDDIKAVFENGKIWEYQIIPSGRVNADCEIIDDVDKADIDFIKSLSAPAFEESNQLDKYGLWTGSKKACRTCVIICSVPSVYDGKSCIADEFSVTITSDDSYTVEICYHFTEAPDSGKQQVLISFKS